MIPRNLAPAARYIIAIPGQFATPALFNTANDEFAGRFSAEEKFPNNERRASNESDKDSIVDSTCNLSLRREARAIMFVIAMRRNSPYLPYQTTGNLSIAFLSKCPINNNLITLRCFLRLNCQAGRINDL